MIDHEVLAVYTGDYLTDGPRKMTALQDAIYRLCPEISHAEKEAVIRGLIIPSALDGRVKVAAKRRNWDELDRFTAPGKDGLVTWLRAKLTESHFPLAA